MPRPRVIGLTGNIACGKTTVAKTLAGLGFAVVDADDVSRSVTSLGSPVLGELRKAFGPGIFSPDGRLDRAGLRALVFSEGQSGEHNDQAKRKLLESILHPAIRKRSLELFKELAAKGREPIIYEATLLLESGRIDDFEGVLLVTCPDDAQTARLRARDSSLSAELAQQIIASQMPQAEKRRLATWVLENDGTEKDLLTKVERWAKSI